MSKQEKKNEIENKRDVCKIFCQNLSKSKSLLSREKKLHAQIFKNELRIIFVAFDILTRVEKIKTCLKVYMAYKTLE